MLFRKMLRDMKNNKMQFVSIFIMAFLGVFIYIGIGAEWYGIQQVYNSYFEETEMADAWVYGENMTDRDVRDILRVEGVTAAENRLTIKTIGDFGNKPEITLSYIGDEEISNMVIVSGKEYDSSIDGIWLDDNFAKAKRLEVGDEITLKALGLEIEKEIVGTITHPEYVYHTYGTEMFPDRYKCGFAFISENYFPKNMTLFHTEILIKTERDDMEEFEKDISDALNGDYSIFVAREDFQSYSMLVDEVAQHKAIGSVLPIAFLAIAILAILTTMTRLVANQRTQIGSLKALGFSTRTILAHYISYGFWLSLAGSITGAVVGPITIPFLFYPTMSQFYTLPDWRPGFSPLFISMIILSVVSCTAAAYFSCNKVLKDTPAQTLRPKSPPAPKGKMHHAKFWQKLSFNTQWNIRDTLRGKMRSLMAIVGVAGCTGLIVCALGSMDSMRDIGSFIYMKMNSYNTLMTVSDSATQLEIDSVLHRFNSGSEMQASAEFSFGNTTENGIITITEANGLVTYYDKDENPVEIRSDGVMLSNLMASDLGVKVGDTISWNFFGDEKVYRSKVVGTYFSPTVQGFVATREYYEGLANELNYKPTSIFTAEKVEKLYPGISNVQDNTTLYEAFEQTLSSMFTMIYLLILAAAILAVVVLYNLGILSYTEKERELATLKVIGFQGRKLRYLLFQQNIWLTIVGCIFGFPFGYWLIEVMVASMKMDMKIVVSAFSIILSILLTFAFSITVNIIFSRRINDLDMVSSLKGVE